MYDSTAPPELCRCTQLLFVCLGLEIAIDPLDQILRILMEVHLIACLILSP